MMTSAILITLCGLLLLGYGFDLTSKLTKIPSVILLLLLGWMVRQAGDWFGIQIPNLDSLLPVLGTIGLILIVLEGALELELKKDKMPVILQSFWIALIPMFILAFALMYLFATMGGYGWKNSLLNSIPICVISSAIAIPSVSLFSARVREFVIYETSFSDIFGVLFFNFVSANAVLSFASVGNFGFQLLAIFIISLVATWLLSLLLSRIDHHIKFIPIILLVILIYALTKEFHLPGLIFILIFGLFLGNVSRLPLIPGLQKFNPSKLADEIVRFKEVVVESTFLIRTLFFLLFGFLIENQEIVNPASLVWALGIVAGFLALRAGFLFIFKKPLEPFLFVAPRGLITILLFLSIPEMNQIELVSRALITQVILLSALVMMIGLMFSKKELPEKTDSFFPF